LLFFSSRVGNSKIIAAVKNNPRPWNGDNPTLIFHAIASRDALEFS
jgi:hypothetical protein